jgi:DNA mismatch repair protein MSH5
MIDLFSIGDGKLVLLTGPNACGKSVYLKQVGIIAYLAHLGSFVPAESADLPLLTSIYSRIQVKCVANP